MNNLMLRNMIQNHDKIESLTKCGEGFGNWRRVGTGDRIVINSLMG